MGDWKLLLLATSTAVTEPSTFFLLPNVFLNHPPEFLRVMSPDPKRPEAVRPAIARLPSD